jgi:hypothetical protein
MEEVHPTIRDKIGRLGWTKIEESTNLANFLFERRKLANFNDSQL